MKTPEEMAKRYVEQEQLEYEEAGGAYYGFIAGYTAAQPKWISVKERLPEKQMVLCNCKDGYELGYYGRYGQEQWHNTLGTDTLQVTHWMPLPEPPKENE